MSRKIKSLCCAPGTNTVVVGQLHFKNKFIEKDIRFAVTGGWRGDWKKMIKRYELLLIG